MKHIAYRKERINHIFGAGFRICIILFWMKKSRYRQKHCVTISPLIAKHETQLSKILFYSGYLLSKDSLGKADLKHLIIQGLLFLEFNSKMKLGDQLT